MSFTRKIFWYELYGTSPEKLDDVNLELILEKMTGNRLKGVLLCAEITATI